MRVADLRQSPAVAQAAIHPLPRHGARIVLSLRELAWVKAERKGRDGKFKLDDKKVALLEQRVVEYVSSVSGGPLRYTGKSMKESGQDLKHYEQDGRHCARSSATLDQFQVPAEEQND